MKITKILIVIQRSNGDVFISSPLINALYRYFKGAKIDLLVNDDTYAIAKTLANINNIYTFSYKKKKENPLKQEIEIIKKIYKKYDLSINITSSDRSVLYAILASKYSISAIEKEYRKSWWKKLLLTKNYIFIKDKHMIYNNLLPLKLLNIDISDYNYAPKLDKNKISNTLCKFQLNKSNYIIFHPSSKFLFRTYPIQNINNLLTKLIQLNMKIVVTGSNDYINSTISKSLIKHKNILNLISKTTIEEIYILTSQCTLYIGMDTLNTHIAAAYNKNLIAIYGPNSVTQWSPFNSKLKYSPIKDTPPVTRYGNFTIIQSDLDCVPCNKNGCDGLGKSDCLYKIDPDIIFNEVKRWVIK